MAILQRYLPSAAEITNLPGNMGWKYISSSTINFGFEPLGQGDPSIIQVSGKGLSLDGSGLLNGGIIDRIDLLDESGKLYQSLYAINYSLDGWLHPSEIISGRVSYDRQGIGIYFPGTMNGSDLLYGSDAYDVLSGFGGSDIIYGYKGNDIIYGDTEGENYYFYDSDTLYGDEGNDRIYGGRGNDFIYGGAGDDEIAGNNGGPYSPNGKKDLYVPGIDTIEGGAGNDIIYAQYSYSIYSSGVNNPYAYSGGVKADGGDGVDVLAVNLSHIPEGLTLDWRDPSKPIDLSDGTSIRNVERLYVTTGDGDDTLYTGRDTEWIFTQGGNDTVIIDGINPKDVDGRPTYKIVNFGAGDDRLFLTTDINPEQFQLTGGDGFDTLVADYRSRTAPVTIGLPTDFEALEAQGGSGSDLLIGGQIGANKLFGNAGNDNLMGGTKDDVLSGGAGYDQIFGYDGNDVIEGDDEDSIYAGNGDDRVVLRSLGTNSGSAAGGEGIDTLSASGDLTQFKYTGFEILGSDLGSQNLRISAEALNAFSSVETQAITLATAGKVGANFSATAGAGQLTGSTGDDTIDLARLKTAWTVTGEAGDDDIKTGTGSDTLTGGVGNDRLDGGGGADRLEGGAGNDLYYVDNQGDLVIEAKGGGTDTILTSVDWTLAEDAHVEELLSVFQTNTLFTTLTGNSANNVLGGEGFDTLIGRKGDDTYLVNARGDRVIEARGEGFDEVLTITSYALGSGQEIEALGFLRSEKWKSLIDIGSDEWRYDAIDLTGNEFAQTITGNDGNNVLDGGGGADTLKGGLGNDTYRVDNAKDVVVEANGQGRDTVITTVSYRLAAGQSIEILQAADANGKAALALTGNEISNTLIGNAGNNILDGGAGIDEMRGGTGNDTYFVDNARDVVIEAAGQGTDTVTASVSYALGAKQQVEILQTSDAKGTAALQLTGNAFANTLVGNAGHNRLDGGGGIDRMQGLGGNDTYVVDHDRDVVIEAARGGNDTVLARVSYTLTAGQEIETLVAEPVNAKAALNLTGNAFANTLTGHAGSNALDGGAGNDTLAGKLGADVLTGGAGADSFVFDTALGAGNVDRVRDFSSKDDRFVLDDAIFGGLKTGALKAVQFKNISTAKVDADDHILYKQKTGELFFDADGSGSKAAILFAVIENRAAIDQSDFFVV